MLCGVFGGGGSFGEVYLGVGQLHLGSTSKIGRLVPSLVLVFKTTRKLNTSFRLALIKKIMIDLISESWEIGRESCRERVSVLV